MRQQVKRVVAIIMTVAMLVGLFPLEVFAQNSQRAADTQTLTASVDYDSAERATATVTYHKVGEAAPACNIVFLLDASIQGGAATAQFKNMVSANAGALVAGTNANMQVISYTQNVTNHGSATTSEGFSNLVEQVGGSQEGTANAALGLQKAAEAVETVAGNGNPTVVFWVLGDSFGNTQGASVEDELQALSDQLNDDDALITWQLADQPNDLIEKYATAEGAAKTAAYAESDADTFRNGMLDSLEHVLHDHYRDTSFTLSLAEDQTLAEKITSAKWKMTNGNTLSEVKPEIAEDGRSVTVTFDKLCANLSGDLVLELQLDISTTNEQTVFEASQQTPDKLYTGFFDENKGEKIFSFPAVMLDRSQYTITFEAGDDVTGTAPDAITAMPGQYVTLPDEGNLTNSGCSFGGWNVKGSNTFYSAGQIIAMPANDLTLTPAWGHVEVELELGKVNYAEANGKQMASNVTYQWGGLLNFNNALVDGQEIFSGKVHSIRVVDQKVTYGSVSGSGDRNQVEVTAIKDSEGQEIDPDSVLYARHVGATDEDRVVAYLTECQCSDPADEKYDLIIAGPGGVVAPEKMNNWMEGNGTVETIDLTALDTSNVTTMGSMFHNCKSLKKVIFGENYDTSQVTNMADMFSACSSLSSVDFSMFDTSKVTSMGGMFWHCYRLQNVNLSSFDLKEVVNASSMFEGSGLTSITFNTNTNAGKIEDMHSMFYGCSSLTTLTLPKITPPAKNAEGQDTKPTMQSMFRHCKSLTSLDLSSFDTVNVKNMYYMFDY